MRDRFGQYTLLAGAVVLVMTSAGVGCSQFAGGDEAPSAELLPQFREDAWFLPDEELLGFIEIPDGSFTMGSGEANATEQHTVDLPRYFIGRYEVTVAQFRACVDAGGCSAGDIHALSGPDDHPVRLVSWHEAVAYCEWLTTQLQGWRGHLIRSVACFVETAGRSCCRVRPSGSGRRGAQRGGSFPGRGTRSTGRERTTCVEMWWQWVVMPQGSRPRASLTWQVTSLSGLQMTGTTITKLRALMGPPGETSPAPTAECYVAGRSPTTRGTSAPPTVTGTLSTCATTALGFG